MFTAEELRQAKIFACLDEAECARLTQIVADVRLSRENGFFERARPLRSTWCWRAASGSFSTSG